MFVCRCVALLPVRARVRNFLERSRGPHAHVVPFFSLCNRSTGGDKDCCLSVTGLFSLPTTTPLFRALMHTPPSDPAAVAASTAKTEGPNPSPSPVFSPSPSAAAAGATAATPTSKGDAFLPLFSSVWALGLNLVTGVLKQCGVSIFGVRVVLDCYSMAETPEAGADPGRIEARRAARTERGSGGVGGGGSGGGGGASTELFVSCVEAFARPPEGGGSGIKLVARIEQVREGMRCVPAVCCAFFCPLLYLFLSSFFSFFLCSFPLVGWKVRLR